MSGTVSTVTVGTNYTATATPNTGYSFLYWRLNGAIVSTATSYTIVNAAGGGNYVLTAYFIDSSAVSTGVCPIKIEYYGSTSWVPLTVYATKFQVQETGITRIPSATVNLEGARSNLDTFITGMYRLIRISFSDRGIWQTIFYGYVNQPHVKSIAGTDISRCKINLDCLNFAARLDDDYVTYDYFKDQSALSPSTTVKAWTYRTMIENMLATPDSSRDNTNTSLGAIDFELVADNDEDGLDHVVESASTWTQQTIFDTIRTTLDRIGYDGYYYCNSETSTPQIIVGPFDKDSVVSFSAPYLGEPEFVGGSLSNVKNVIFKWGDVDAGVPSDGDRWTELGATKYDPVVWAGQISDGSLTISDVDNAHFIVNAETETEVNYGAGSKSIRFMGSDPAIQWITAQLNITNTEAQNIDCLVRCTSLNFAFYSISNTNFVVPLVVSLVDANGQRINYSRKPATNDVGGTPIAVSIPVGFNNTINIFADATRVNGVINIDILDAEKYADQWYYTDGSSNFDWSNIRTAYFTVILPYGYVPISNWGFELDGVQFAGGLKIEPFQPYSELLNPPSIDQTSIDTYGIHVLPLQDNSLMSFEQAAAEGDRLLANLKNTVNTLTFTKTPTTLLYPGQVVSVDGTLQRLSAVTYDWSAETKKLIATYTAVAKLSPLPPIWTEENMQRYLIK